MGVCGIGLDLLIHSVCILMRFMGAAQCHKVSLSHLHCFLKPPWHQTYALLFAATMASNGGMGACISESV
jgi:hypothetical protein